jgi:hypothetical protein
MEPTNLSKGIGCTSETEKATKPCDITGEVWRKYLPSLGFLDLGQNNK